MMLKPHETTRTAAPGVAHEQPAPETTVSSLDIWVRRDWTEGVDMTALTEFQQLHVRTRNSVYELVVVDRMGEVRVRGGRHFPDWTKARLTGSSAGGSLLKSLGIYLGLGMELETEERRILTSPVHTIITLNAQRHA
jgi:hypothetical protein